MEITDIRIRKVAADGKLKAYVTVTFDDCFVVHNVNLDIQEFHYINKVFENDED